MKSKKQQLLAVTVPLLISGALSANELSESEFIACNQDTHTLKSKTDDYEHALKEFNFYSGYLESLKETLKGLDRDLFDYGQQYADEQVELEHLEEEGLTAGTEKRHAELQSIVEQYRQQPYYIEAQTTYRFLEQRAQHLEPLLKEAMESNYQSEKQLTQEREALITRCFEGKDFSLPHYQELCKGRELFPICELMQQAQ